VIVVPSVRFVAVPHDRWEQVTVPVIVAEGIMSHLQDPEPERIGQQGTIAWNPVKEGVGQRRASTQAPVPVQDEDAEHG